MKVNQIVGEHKKGFRANIYRKKKVIAPQSTEVKPMEEDAKITKSDQQGVEITADTGIKTILPADKATALAPDPQNPNEYDLNPAAVNPGASGSTGPTPPKVGASVEMKTAEAAEDLGTVPTQEFVKGIYSLAAEHGAEAPNPDAVKKMMVLAPNGEVDMAQTFKKIIGQFQAQLPEIQKMMAELEELIKQAEAQQVGQQQAANPDLARIQELAGMTDEDTVSPRFGGYQQTKHDNGDTTDDYSAGPMSVRTRKDAKGNTVSTDAQYDLGANTIKMNQNQVGVNTLTAQGPEADQFVGTDASAQRKGVDPAKFAQFKQQAGVQESAELKAMLTIAGLR